MLNWVLLFVSLILSAFFSSAESALLSITQARANSLGDKYIECLKKEEELTVISILLGNNLVNVLASSLAAELSLIYLKNFGIALATLIMTFVLLTFGEVIPKSLALYRKESYLKAISKVLYYWLLLTKPISLFYVNLIRIIKKTFKMKKSKEITEGEIEEILVLGEKNGEITKYEKRIAINALDLADIKVKEIMKPRGKVYLAPIDDSISDLKTKIDEDDINYSRIPIYYGSKNNVIGYIKVSDLIGENGNKKLYSILRPILIISPKMNTESLLKLIRKTGIPIAAVKEEGNFLGIVTITDVLDEIIGEIKEEKDLEELKRGD